MRPDEVWPQSSGLSMTVLTQVAEYIAGSVRDIWVLTDGKDVPIGFLGVAGDAIAALFMDPSHRGRGERLGGPRRALVCVAGIAKRSER